MHAMCEHAFGKKKYNLQGRHVTENDNTGFVGG